MWPLITIAQSELIRNDSSENIYSVESDLNSNLEHSQYKLLLSMFIKIWFHRFKVEQINFSWIFIQFITFKRQIVFPNEIQIQEIQSSFHQPTKTLLNKNYMLSFLKYDIRINQESLAANKTDFPSHSKLLLIG